MKKTLTVNLNNVVFHIDDDAYESLKNYLSDIESHFKNDEEKEDIMADIEARIAELFSEQLDKNKNVITLQNVNEVIGIMGNPNQYTEEEPTENKEASNKTKKNQEKKKRSKRFYRDPENTIIGGVASGLSAYLGWDVTLIRIILILLAFFGFGSIILVYLIIWIITPAAVTPSQRLEMQGEDVTVESIKSEFDNAKNYVQSEEFKKSAKSAGSTIGDILLAIIKGFFIFIGGVLAFAGIVTLLALLFTLLLIPFAPYFSNFTVGFFDITTLSTHNSIFIVFALLFILVCPIILIVYTIFKKLSQNKKLSKRFIWTNIILWIVGICMLATISIRTGIQLKKDGRENYAIEWNTFSYQDEIRLVDPFHTVNATGNIKIILSQDTIQKLMISAPENYLPKIRSQVKNETLFVDLYEEKTARFRGVNVNRTAPIVVNITSDNLERITAAGATAIRTESKLNCENLSISLAGASNAEMEVDVRNKLNISMAGASKVEISGKTHIAKFSAAGASKIDARDLIASEVDIDVAGAGKATVFAEKKLNARASGASKITCYGNPETVSKSDHPGSKVKVK